MTQRIRLNMRCLWYAAALCLGILIGIVLTGSFAAPMTEEKDAESENPTAQVGAVGEASVLPDTEICWTYHFSRCGHEKKVTEIDGILTGYTKSDIEKKYPDITVQTMSGSAASLLLEVDTYCPDHYYLQASTNGLQVMRTDPDTFEQIVAMTLAVDTEQLSEETRRELSQGVMFDSLEQINAYLENVES